MCMFQHTVNVLLQIKLILAAILLVFLAVIISELQLNFTSCLE